MLQQSLEWIETRKNHIGASDAPIIDGVSPFKTIQRLWQEKVGLVEEDPPTYHMLKGIYLEPVARDHFIQATGITVMPAVLFSIKYPFMMASLDGISQDGQDVVEIKCPGKKNHKMACMGKIPPCYMPQLYHQMVVAQVDRVHYWSFDGVHGAHLLAYRDEQKIKDLIEREKEFWDCVQNFREPQ